MKYGYFDNINREYIITTPKTPVKWINYVGGLPFGGFIDNTGGATLCKGDPTLNRIIKYIPQLPDSDFKGETLYIRIKNAKGDYKVFSPFFVPTLDPYDSYECHVGMGYNRYISQFYGIEADITVFVPVDDQIYIRDIKIKNKTSSTLEIDIVPVVEFTHYNALMQFTNADWVPQTMQTRLIDEAFGMKTLSQCTFARRNEAENFFTANKPISSFESDRRNFLGDNGYGTWGNPLSLQNDELSSTEAYRGDNIGALLIKLGNLAPMQEKRVITLLTQDSTFKKAIGVITKYRDESNVDKAFDALKDFWDQYLSVMQVNTPDPNMTTVLNIFNPRQCLVTKNWARYLSLYQLGYGSRGLGYRDSNQDVLGMTPNQPQEARALISKILHVQKQDGSAYHQFNPLSMEASAGDAQEMKDRPQYYGDDHLWSILSVTNYLKETNNLAYLEEQIPFYEKDEKGKPLETAPVLEHLKRAIEFTKKDVGAHGLPLLGFADWNDSVNLRTGAESMFNANLYGKALLEIIELMQYMARESVPRKAEEYSREAVKFTGYYNDMKEKYNKYAWDGEWFIRYFDYDGAPLGSHKNETGKIFLNGQSWPVLSGFADETKARQCLDAVKKYLNTSKGIKLSTPGFNGYSPDKGGVSTYPPGAKENGGIFLHSNPWVIIAETMMGNGNRAYEYYNQLNPAAKNDIIDEFECEPYSYPQNILSDEHPQFGLGRNSWLTGTASWMYTAATKYILGIRPVYIGLLIDPCIPSNWDGFKVTRKFRNAVYKISVKNPEHICKGVKSIIVDGKVNSDLILPIFGDNKDHHVDVVMG